MADATEEYGVSRPTYYQARTNFDKRGVGGLLPQKRGPRGPHKLQGEVLTFVEQQLVSGEPVRAPEMVKLIQQEFGFKLHPRTIERAIAGKKTAAMTSATNDSAEPGDVVTQYEMLRKAALGDALPPDTRASLMLFLQRGMWGWSCAWPPDVAREPARLAANGREAPE